MECKTTKCIGCGQELAYWTLGNQIICTHCNETIKVEPCILEVEETEIEVGE